MNFSFVIPVYNRPDEVKELLQSLCGMQYEKPFEVVVVEDGSTETSKDVIDSFSDKLKLSYFEKENTGPGDSRNFGMKHAKGDYFIILDSDCILPNHYLKEVAAELNRDFVHCFGGPDAAHESFSDTQKAIDFTMTSFLTTGGIRGGKKSVGKFQPRSFNMGISKEAFEKTGGFGTIHPGEDPDLTFRIWKAGYATRLFSKTYVYHKRRIDWSKFFKQVRKFGMVRPILNKWHPDTAKITYWIPAIFSVGLLGALVLFFMGWMWPLLFFAVYMSLILISAILKGKGVKVAFLAVFAALIQFFGYGFGFLKSTILVNFSNRHPEELFPELFFSKK